MKRELPFVLVFIFALFNVVQYFVPHGSFEFWYEFLLDWVYIIGIFALALGIWSLFRVSVDRISARRPNWAYNFVTLIGLFAMMAFGFTAKEPAAVDSGHIAPNKTYTHTFFNDKATPVANRYFIPAHKGAVGVVVVEGKEGPAKPTDTSLTKIAIANNAFAPDSLVVANGSQVTWTNQDSQATSVLSVGADSWGTYWIWVPLFMLLVFTLVQVIATKEAAKRNLYVGASLVLLAVEIVLPVMDSHWGFFFYTQQGLNNAMFVNFFDYIMIPIQTTMFALLAFFIASAAYRAFRARNLLATLLLFAALIVMLRFNPYLPFAAYWAKASNWLMNVPNLAAQRAIVIGLGLGSVATSIKVMLGIERGYMGRG